MNKRKWMKRTDMYDPSVQNIPTSEKKDYIFFTSVLLS